MFTTQTFANMKKKPKRHKRIMPSNNTRQARKVLRAHNKFGTESLSPNQIDNIPGLETLNIGDSNQCIKI